MFEKCGVLYHVFSGDVIRRADLETGRSPAKIAREICVSRTRDDLRV